MSKIHDALKNLLGYKKQSRHKHDHSAMWCDLTSSLSLKAINTQKQYVAVLNELCAHIDTDPKTDDGALKLLAITHSQVTAYIAWCKNRPAQQGRSREKSDRVAASTVGRKIIILSAIWDELISLGYTSSNPFSRFRAEFDSARTNTRRPHQMVDFSAVQALLQSADLRDRVILILLFCGALRRSEVIDLRICDVTLSETGAARLNLRNTKRQEAETRSLSSKYAPTLIEYKNARLASGAKPLDCFIEALRDGVGTNRPMSQTGFYRHFMALMERAGLPREITPHCARATAITKLLEAGYSHRDVMKVSGHSSVQMVSHYDKMRGANADSIVEGLDYDKK